VTQQRLKFNEEDHSYLLDGKPIPSVTTILRDVGLYPDFQFVDDWYAERGTRVHQACHYLDKDTLDLDQLVTDDEQGIIVPFVESYKKFKLDYKFQVEGSEIQVFNEAFWYAGTYDKKGTIIFDGVKRDTITDLKCGGPEFGYQFQLAGYALAENNPYTLRLSVHLDKAGKLPNIIEHDQPGDFEIFKAGCLVHHAKNRGK